MFAQGVTRGDTSCQIFSLSHRNSQFLTPLTQVVSTEIGFTLATTDVVRPIYLGFGWNSWKIHHRLHITHEVQYYTVLLKVLVCRGKYLSEKLNLFPSRIWKYENSSPEINTFKLVFRGYLLLYKWQNVTFHILCNWACKLLLF